MSVSGRPAVDVGTGEVYSGRKRAWLKLGRPAIDVTEERGIFRAKESAAQDRGASELKGEITFGEQFDVKKPGHGCRAKEATRGHGWPPERRAWMPGAEGRVFAAEEHKGRGPCSAPQDAGSGPRKKAIK